MTQIEEVEKENDKKKEIENEIKDLKDKLSKKEEDYNRVNINYAKLLKKSKNPENDQEKLIQTINNLKIENKKLYKSLMKSKSEKNIIGISFIEDDLDNSFFIDDFCFDNVLDELNKNGDKFMAMNNTISRSYNHKKKEYIKLEDYNKEQKNEDQKKNKIK